MMDVVIPKGNEAEFIKTGKRLGFTGLVFLYRHLPKEQDYDFRIIKALMAESRNDMRKARRFALVMSSNHDLIQERKVDLILTNEELNAKDHIHQRRSGLNEMLCKEAKLFALSFNKLLLAKHRPAVFGRQQQNAMLFNKFKNKVIIASFATSPSEMRAPRDLVAYCRCLGLQKAKEAALLLENYKY